MKTIECEGKTREEAIQNGLKTLGIEMHDVEKIEVIDEGSKGFLGFGVRNVRVRLSVDRPTVSQPPRERAREERRGPRPPDRPRDRDERRGGNQGAAQQRPDRPRPDGGRPERGRQDRQERPRQDGGRPDREQKDKARHGRDRRKDGAPSGSPRPPQSGSGGGQQRPQAPAADRPRQPKASSLVEEADAAVKRAQFFAEGNELEGAEIMDAGPLPEDARSDEEIEPITDDQGKEAAAMLRGIITLMGMDATVTFQRSGDGIARLVVDSEDGAILIGKRGNTLNAIQYLVNRIVARNDTAENTERILVDVGGYLERRRAMLTDMALKMAKRAKDSRRNVRLKPLSPQERRLVHLALQTDPDIRTYSLGDSLFRSIIINPVGADAGAESGRRRSNGRHRPAAADIGPAQFGDD